MYYVYVYEDEYSINDKFEIYSKNYKKKPFFSKENILDAAYMKAVGP